MDDADDYVLLTEDKAGEHGVHVEVIEEGEDGDRIRGRHDRPEVEGVQESHPGTHHLKATIQLLYSIIGKQQSNYFFMLYKCMFLSK